MINIQKEKDYGVLFHIKNYGLDETEYENKLIHIKECLEELHYSKFKSMYPGSSIVDFSFSTYGEKDEKFEIIMEIYTERGKFNISLPESFIISDSSCNLDMKKYKVSVLDNFNNLQAELKLYPQIDHNGYETVNHKEDDHIYYCLKALRRFL